jgi:hypothetical protein
LAVSIGDALVALIVESVIADALSERVGRGVGEAGSDACEGGGVKGISSDALAVSDAVDVATGWASLADVIDVAVSRGTDAVSVDAD